MATKKPLVLSSGQVQELQSGDTVSTDSLGSGTANNTTFLRGDSTWATPAGGVTGFTASQNTASPNDTVNASRLVVDATSTNADAVIQPKGTGALLAQLPDSTSTGGNKRGANAVDLQTSRSAANEVASGLRSINIGTSNRASGQDAVSIGATNIASGLNSLAMGQSNTASGQSSTTFGRQSTASAYVSCVIGESVEASAQYAFAFGGNSIASRYGMHAVASGRFSANADCQMERYIIRRQTTDATQTELSANGSAPAATTRIAVATDSTYTFSALITARRTDADNESAGYKIEGVIDNNAGTTALVGTPTVTILGEDTAAWDVVAEADNTNDALVFKVTGEAAKTIRWGGVVTLMKVTG